MTETDGTMDAIAFTRGLVMARLADTDEAIAERTGQWRQHRRLSCIRIIDKHRVHHFGTLDMAYPSPESVDIDVAMFKTMANRQHAAGKQRVARAAKGRGRDNLQVIHGCYGGHVVVSIRNECRIPVKKPGLC